MYFGRLVARCLFQFLEAAFLPRPVYWILHVDDSCRFQSVVKISTIVNEFMIPHFTFQKAQKAFPPLSPSLLLSFLPLHPLAPWL